jgi:hypothetical protein
MCVAVTVAPEVGKGREGFLRFRRAEAPPRIPDHDGQIEARSRVEGNGGDDRIRTGE